MFTATTKSLRYGLSLLGVTAALLGGCQSNQQASTAPKGLENIAPTAGTPAGAPASVAPPTTSVVAAPMAPPPVREEIVPTAPAPGMAWIPGYWNFTGATWTWVPGRYETPPRPSAQWTPGHWTPQSGGGGLWVWVAGRWS